MPYRFVQNDAVAPDAGAAGIAAGDVMPVAVATSAGEYEVVVFAVGAVLDRDNVVERDRVLEVGRMLASVTEQTVALNEPAELVMPAWAGDVTAHLVLLSCSGRATSSD